MCQPKLLMLGPGEDCLGRRPARGWPLEKPLPFPAGSNPTSIPGPAISLSRRHVFPGKPFHGPLWLHVAFLVFHTHRIHLLLEEKKLEEKCPVRTYCFPFDTAMKQLKTSSSLPCVFPNQSSGIRGPPILVSKYNSLPLSFPLSPPLPPLVLFPPLP